jgi:hypothetical protein
VNYGADPTGAKDSTLAIGEALTAAEAVPGSEVYFPAGRFILTKRMNHLFDYVISSPVNIVGAGPALTTIVNEVGAKVAGITHGTDLFVIDTGPNAAPGGGDGTTISGMTLDAASYDAGTTIMDFANNTTLSNLVIEGARSTLRYNPGVFGMRVIAICNPTTRADIFRSNNTVRNVQITGNGSAGNTELDLSCQHNSTVQNVNIQGNGMDIFYCTGDTFSNLSFTQLAKGNLTWIITGSHNITLNGLTLANGGGTITADSNDISSGITISNETMQNKADAMKVGDVVGLTITNSSLGNLVLDPGTEVSGVNVSATTFGLVHCYNVTAISSLSGLSCS